MSRRIEAPLFRVGASALLLLTGCPRTTTREHAVTIGGLLDVTGNVAEQGTEELMAARLAVSEINAAGGVLGKTLVLDNRNPDWDEAKVQSLAHELADAGIGVAIGPTASKLSMAGATVASQRSMVMISGWSTTPLLTTVPDNGFFFRTIPSDALQGRVVAQRAYARGLRKAAIIYAPHAYGEGLSAVFASAFTALGGTVTWSEAYPEETGADYNGLVRRALASDPETIVLIAYAVEGAKITRAYTDSFAQQGKFWFFTDGCAEKEFITLVGAEKFSWLAHEGTNPTVAPSTTREAFHAAFRSTYGQEVGGATGAIQTYDAVYLAALAMTAAGASDGVSVRDALPGVSRPPGEAFTPAQYSAAVDALRAGRDIDYVGASGPVDFDDFGDVLGPYAIWRIESGAFVNQGDPVVP